MVNLEMLFIKNQTLGKLKIPDDYSQLKQVLYNLVFDIRRFTNRRKHRSSNSKSKLMIKFKLFLTNSAYYYYYSDAIKVDWYNFGIVDFIS